MNSNLYVFDLDGTLADCSHRLHFIQQTPPDWHAFFSSCVDDPPIKWVLTLARRMQNYGSLVILTGRSEDYREHTEGWLHDYLRYFTLLMRPSKDFRQDMVVKPEILKQYLNGDKFRHVEFIVEDRAEMAGAWRILGYNVLHIGNHDGASSVSKRMENGEHAT